MSALEYMQHKKPAKSARSRSSRRSRTSAAHSRTRAAAHPRKSATQARKSVGTVVGSSSPKDSAKQITRKLPVVKYKKTPSQQDGRNVSHASQSMNLTDLQFMARSLGIPFGGLTKGALIHKINLYK